MSGTVLRASEIFVFNPRGKSMRKTVLLFLSYGWGKMWLDKVTAYQAELGSRLFDSKSLLTSSLYCHFKILLRTT